MKILLVEATISKKTSIKKALGPCFPVHQVTDVDSLDGALLQLSQTSFDVLLLSQSLLQRPNSNALKTLRALPSEQRCGIVIISEQETLAQSYQWLSEGAHDWIERSEITSRTLIKALTLAKFRSHQEESLKQALTESQKRAEKDHLTGIANRRFFENAFNIIQSKVMRRQTGLALLLFDLDHFKEVNDTFGHNLGDEVLQCVAARLSEFTRTEEVFARLGGDEFVLIVSGDNSNNDAIRLARRILQAVCIPMKFHGKVIHMTASIGIAAQQSHDQSISSLLSHADIALYQAKNSGRNRLCFFQKEIQRNFEQNQRIEKELKHAVSNRLFDLHYQPIIDLNTKKKVGYEAYLRLLLDDKIHNATNFIHCAEEADVLWEMGHWSIETAISTLQVLQAQEPDNELFISINLSYKQLEEERLIDLIEKTLSLYQVAPGKVVIELTEMAFRGHSGIRTANIHKLANLGCKIAIDDFGSGSTCLECLRTYPIHQAKITSALVQSEDNLDYLSAVVTMLDALNIEVVLKELETETQFNRISTFKNALAQGMYFEAPRPQSLLQREAVSSKRR